MAATGDERRLVLVTGGAGKVATQICRHLRASYRLRLVDVRPPPPEVATDIADEVQLGDLSDTAAVHAAVDGVHAIVHLAGEASPTATWASLQPLNVQLTERLLRAAHISGIDRVVLASSLHAAGAYVAEGSVPVDPSWPARPCCLYGASKVALEALGWVYASRHGLGVTCLRVGWASPRPRTARALRTWISARDLAHLIDCSLGSARQFGIYFGVSANSRGILRIDNAQDELGYRPVDDSEWYADDVAADEPATTGCFASSGTNTRPSQPLA